MRRAIWRPEPTMKVIEAKETPASTNAKCSGRGREVPRVRMERTKAKGYAILRPAATNTATTRYVNHPTRTEENNHCGTKQYS
jgi:hypothetical protein